MPTAYQHMNETWLKEQKKRTDLIKGRLIVWRKQGSIVKLNRPSRLGRARSLGYKAKQGYIVVRIKTGRGPREKPRPRMGRKPRSLGVVKYTPKKSRRWIAEDPNHPVIYNDPNINWICDPAQKGRENRGLTSAGKRSRGLRKKGRGAEKMRPSLGAKGNLGK